MKSARPKLILTTPDAMFLLLMSDWLLNRQFGFKLVDTPSTKLSLWLIDKRVVPQLVTAIRFTDIWNCPSQLLDMKLLRTERRVAALSQFLKRTCSWWSKCNPLVTVTTFAMNITWLWDALIKAALAVLHYPMPGSHSPSYQLSTHNAGIKHLKTSNHTTMTLTVLMFKCNERKIEMCFEFKRHQSKHTHLL